MTEYTLKPGDTIKCRYKHEVLRLMHELRKEGYIVRSENKVITILDKVANVRQD